MLSNEYRNVSLSHGTMRPEDLIPVFSDFIKEHSKNNYDWLLDRYAFQVDDESKGWMLDDMFEILNNIAPNGYYFGSHPGDGSDYGFWECEEEW